MKHATGTIRGGHNPKRPYRATAASRRYTTPRCRIGRPGAMASAAPAWPQAALQRFQALEPAPFLPQRLGLDLLEAPKPLTARPRVVAAACALPAARLVGAEAERSQQIALRAPDQIVAHAQWTRQPLFEREPPRKASRAYGSSPRHGLMSFARCPFATCAYPLSRCGCAPEFCLRQEKPSQKASPKSIPKKTPPLKEGRRSAEKRTNQEPHRKDAAHVLSCLPTAGGPRPRTHRAVDLNGAGALAFRRPTAASEVLASARLRPRFLEPPDANGRTLSGTSAASTSRSGTRRTGRCPSRPRAQCIAALHENRSRSASRSTLAKGVPLRAGFWLGNRYGDKCQGHCRFIRDLAQGGVGLSRVRSISSCQVLSPRATAPLWANDKHDGRSRIVKKWKR